MRYQSQGPVANRSCTHNGKQTGKLMQRTVAAKCKLE